LRRDASQLGALPGNRRLPLLFDILQIAAADHPSGAYLVLTNADICLQPHFYQTVGELLAHGFDALIINRRTVDAGCACNRAIAAAELGETHPGLDCFVFPARWVRDFTPSDSVIGAGLVMRSLLANLVCRAEALAVLTQAHLTFHFGDDRHWSKPEMAIYTQHNKAAAKQTVDSLSENAEYRDKLDAFVQAKPKYAL